MKRKLINRFIPFILILVFAACSFGCATQIYYWGNYEDQLYSYLNGESKEAQIQNLVDVTGKIKAGNKKTPPGLYAHLGMLYSEIGNDGEAIACFETEKSLFPEAAAYMNFLLKRYGR